MTAVTVYRSDDASAPVLSGAAGALIGVLDAILVNGYGAKAAAGWTKDFTGTFKAAYKMSTGTPSMLLRVDDTGAQDARVVGYESMTDVDTGSGPFPTAAQVTGGLYCRKSSTADATARPWIALANDKFFMIWCFAAQTTLGNTASTDQPLAFGKFVSYKTGDAYNCMIMANTSATTQQAGAIAAPATSMPSATAGLYVARAYTQIGGSIQGIKFVYSPNSNTYIGQTGDFGSQFAYPDPITSGLRLNRVQILEDGGSSKVTERGHIPGFWAPLTKAPAANLDTFSGTGDLTGKNFVLLPVYNGANAGRCAFETSDTWGL